WFNSSMDRVSGWYKRRAQIIILILGLAVTIAMNADTISIIKKLSTDKPLRDSLVAAAEVYAKENATPTPTPTPAPGTASTAATPVTPASSATPVTTPAAKPSPSANPSPSPSPSASPSASPSVSPSVSPTNSPAKGTTAAASPSPTPPECVNDKNSPECKLAKNKQEILSLGLPMGWSGGYHNTLPGKDCDCSWWDQLQWHWLGWLITAIAISLGAPFWFDLLNKFIVVRSTVKPHEKSPEEKSKE
ncbi:MAG TPA: hypothetical protein VKB86_21345, partial [Pyrinomonadaceae bacterium]|nr:hypothetical protein [Pyrinomonadaceae bacterium]